MAKTKKVKSAKQKKVQDTFKRAVKKYKEHKKKHPTSGKKVSDFVKAEFK